MGIWIRSQDGEGLTYVSNIQIDEDGKTIFDNDNYLGTYDSKEEAMEVLDMIQEQITYHERMRLLPSEDWETPRIVFQMPPAGFSKAGDPE